MAIKKKKEAFPAKIADWSELWSLSSHFKDI